ncbi:MAG: GTP-binding protein Era [Halioglobus sp.]|jgi:GTP-binding protein Era
MNRFAYSSFEDADVLLFVLDLFEGYEGDEKVIQLLRKSDAPKYLIINKIDLDKDDKLANLKSKWADILSFDKTFEISALNKIGLEDLMTSILSELKEGPAYYPKDQLSDKNVRFFVSEIVRECILTQYKQEVPYSCEVIIDEYKDSEKNGKPFAHIYGTIYVSRKTQKGILIGKAGSAIKKLGTDSRIKIEEFVGHPVFVQMNVKVREGWRDDDRQLKHFGY